MHLGGARQALCFLAKVDEVVGQAAVLEFAKADHGGAKLCERGAQGALLLDQPLRLPVRLRQVRLQLEHVLAHLQRARE